MRSVKPVLLLLIFLFAQSYVLSSHSVGHARSPETDGQNTYRGKFDPRLWERIQELKTNGTSANLSLMIWLDEMGNPQGNQTEDLEENLVSLLITVHNSTVSYIGRVLPVVMASVPLNETETIASYGYVQRIDDGHAECTLALNVSAPAIRADVARSLTGFNGQGIRIAILDSGVDSQHQSLDDLDDNPSTNDPKVIDNQNFVDWDDDGTPDEPITDILGHGTAVAGIAAGTGQGSNCVGVAPGAWIMNIKVATYDNHIQDNDLVTGIDHALNNSANVINLSVESPNEDELSVLSRAADRAVENGVVVVAAAGNYGPNPGTITAPGNAFNVISVGEVDDHDTIDISDDTLAQDSSRGSTSDGRPKPDIVAPGINIWSPRSLTQRYEQRSGTSFAAPHVSGIAALMLQANPNLTPAQAKAILRQTARLNNNLNQLGVNERGWGIVDAAAAVQLAQNPNGIDSGGMYDSWSYQTPVNNPSPGTWEQITFTIDPPSASGISLSSVVFHWWN